MKKQSDLIYKFRDNLQQLSRNELQDLLEYNGQEIPSGNMAVRTFLQEKFWFYFLAVHIPIRLTPYEKKNMGKEKMSITSIVLIKLSQQNGTANHAIIHCFSP